MHFRPALGEVGVEELLATTIAPAMQMGAVMPVEFERVIVDTTVQPKAVAYPTDSRLLEVMHAMLVLAKRAGIQLCQPFAKEGARYTDVEKRDEMPVKWQVGIKRRKIKPMRDGALKDLRIEVERTKGQIRGRVEHPFHVIKNLFGHRKVPYKDPAKNTDAVVVPVWSGESGARRKTAVGFPWEQSVQSAKSAAGKARSEPNPALNWSSSLTIREPRAGLPGLPLADLIDQHSLEIYMEPFHFRTILNECIFVFVIYSFVWLRMAADFWWPLFVTESILGSISAELSP